MSDDGGYGTSAVPIYQLFVEQAKELEPRYLTMVIPSRWLAGGRGWTSSASRCSPTIACARLTTISSAAEYFRASSLKGGICYFLWDTGQSRAMPRHDSFQG